VNRWNTAVAPLYSSWHLLHWLRNSQRENIESGKRDFVTFVCSACHGYSGHGGVEVGAPRIATTALSYTAFAKYVRQPMRSMPRYATEAQLPEVALTDIYAFLKSIPAPPDSKSIPLLQNN